MIKIDVLALLESLPQFWFSVLKELIAQGNKERLRAICQRAKTY